MSQSSEENQNVIGKPKITNHVIKDVSTIHNSPEGSSETQNINANVNKTKSHWLSSSSIEDESELIDTTEEPNSNL